MTSPTAKFGALLAAGALLATVAIPAYAGLGSASATPHRTAPVQDASFASLVTLVVPSRDGYSVTAPRPAVVAVPVVSPPSIRPAISGPSARLPAPRYNGQAVLAYSAQFVGVVPYGTGNTPTTSFSCDGFTQYVFASFGISLPRGADHQARLGTRVSQADAVAGDLVYWPGQHIGIYDGAGGMYNSPAPGRYVEHVGRLWGSPLFIRLTI